MGINVSTAYSQANNIYGNANQLRQVRKSMMNYKNTIIANWQGTEVSSIIIGIDNVIAMLDSSINELDNLSNDIKNTAAAIRREEEAEYQRKVNQAQNNLNSARQQYNSIRSELSECERQINEVCQAGGDPTALVERYESINRRLTNARNNMNNCQNTLDYIRRQSI